jgi:hypothetical protein
VIAETSVRNDIQPLSRLLIVALAAAVAVLAGCSAGSGSFHVVDATLSTSRHQHTASAMGEGPAINDSFESAELVRLSPSLQAVVTGRIEQRNDIDIFNLGPVLAGDRVIVDVTAEDGLQASVALFDHEHNAILVNDAQNAYRGRREPYLDVVVQEDLSACFVAVATPIHGREGSYELDFEIIEGDEMRAPTPQVVYLNFAGGELITVAGRTLANIPEFRAESLSVDYSGTTDDLINTIIDSSRIDFAGIDVEIRTSITDPQPATPFSIIHFGAYDEALLGVADGVDEFNENPAQQAIIFTDTFKAFLPLNPTPEQIGQAIANVTSHEIGHLLGLVHTQDPYGVMDITASLRQMLSDQAFERSPIEPGVFPIGFQDATMTLVSTVGGDIEFARTFAEIRRQLRIEEKVASPADASRLRLTQPFVKCFCDKCVGR